MRRGLTRRNVVKASGGRLEVYARCPGCGGHYDPAELRLRVGNTRGLAVCKPCHLLDGPDGQLERVRG